MPFSIININKLPHPESKHGLLFSFSMLSVTSPDSFFLQRVFFPDLAPSLHIEKNNSSVFDFD